MFVCIKQSESQRTKKSVSDELSVLFLWIQREYLNFNLLSVKIGWIEKNSNERNDLIENKTLHPNARIIY